MSKKSFLILICLIFFGQIAFSKEIPVKIKPISKLTTSNLKVKEGDCVEFLVADDVELNSKIYLKKDEKVFGTITSREENNFLGQTASIYMENFYTKDFGGKKVKLKGVIYEKGTCHDMITGFIQEFLILVRGGEVQINPKKDLFTLYAEVN